MAMAALNSPGFFSFFVGFRFSTRFFSVCDAFFSFKEDKLGRKKGMIPQLTILTHSLKLHCRDLEKEKGDQAKATVWRQNRKIVTPAFE